MINLHLLMLAFAVQANAGEGPTNICTDLARVKVALGERVQVDRSQGGVAYHVSGRTEQFWQVGEISKRGLQAYKTGALLFERDGVQVSRLTQGKFFRGYVAADRHGRLNLFRGSISVLRGTPLDRHFFKRVDFSPAGRASCGKG